MTYLLDLKEHLNVLANYIRFQTHFECNCLKKNTEIRLYIYNINTIKYIVYNTRTLNMENTNSFSKIHFFLKWHHLVSSLIALSSLINLP